jgi:CRISPR-associated endoribonuclease Cas6
MRFKINISINTRRLLLPVDYQYAMASAIYKLIEKGDKAYSRFLHDEGFSPGGLKRFKLFTFSPLSLPRYTHWKNKGLFELHDNSLSFTISFMADKAAEVFIKGMFADQQISIGDRFNKLDAEVTSVEALPPPFFTNIVHYRCIAPLCIKLKQEGFMHEQYLPPDDPRFESIFLQNMIAKCAALNILYTDAKIEHEQLKFQLCGNYRSKLISIKPYTKEETRIRGFIFDFSLHGPEYMHEMGYYAGFGMNNAMGFGAVEIKN